MNNTHEDWVANQLIRLVKDNKGRGTANIARIMEIRLHRMKVRNYVAQEALERAKAYFGGLK